ncbi:hypothetical protein BCR44DRAFT_46508 [Catenaria anguillulae PL171]|uniref:Uncharacterized protein n=1 Tax=Catenaria anguillulae PL171 TaxID=765915 RepID=A0A1Y2I113_9FUNG|nr:hypothetical protein BCR44DRAFT_46508 [Catenaria anguillulae PL171]
MTRPPKTSHTPRLRQAPVAHHSTLPAARRRPLSSNHATTKLAFCPWRTRGRSDSDEEDEDEDGAASGASDVEGDDEEDEGDSMLVDISARTAAELAWSKRQIDKYLDKSEKGEDAKGVAKEELNNFAKASLQAKLMLLYLSVYTIKSRRPLSKEQVAEIKKHVKYFIAGPHVPMYYTGKLATVLVTAQLVSRDWMKVSSELLAFSLQLAMRAVYDARADCEGHARISRDRASTH